MYSLLTPLVVAGVASAAQRPEITMPPILALANVNIASPNACSSVADQALVCLDQFGGEEDDLLNADTDELMACACCVGSDNLASAYSACSTYITDTLPSLTAEADLYGDIYPVCEIAQCSGSSDDSTSSEDSSEEPAMTTTTAEDLDPSATGDDLPELTSVTESVDVPSACEAMTGKFTDCVAETPGFAELPYISQAPCYCCSTRGNNVRYNTDIDDDASECADWAVTADPLTYYDVASVFSTFCQNFSDACDAVALTEPTESPDPTDSDDDSTPTDDATETEETGDATSTGEESNDETSEPDAAVSLRVSAVTALVSLFAFVVVW